MTTLRRNNVTVHGDPEGQPMLFAHGFGCDQNMWRHVWPAFADTHRIVLFDHVEPPSSLLHTWTSPSSSSRSPR